MHGKFLSGYSTERMFFSYVGCSICGAAYCPVYYSQEHLDRLYVRQAENMAEAPLEARLRTQARYARLLLEHSRRAGQFLEIGADNGSFAQACAQVADFEKFWLYEPNEEVRDAIKLRLRGKNVIIRTDRFSSGQLVPQSVSTAALIHVLDHLLDPLAALRDLRAVLEPGGVLLIITHDASSLLARVLGKRWPPYTLQHPHLFTPTSLRTLLDRAGLQTIKIDKTVNYFPLFYFARAACTILGSNPRILRQVDGPLLGLRLGNVAAIAQRPLSRTAENTQ
jgi:SAM-dependent methyltransferase